MSRKSYVQGFTIFGILFVAFAAAIYFRFMPSVQAAPAVRIAEEDQMAPDSWVSRSCTVSVISVNASRVLLICSTAQPTGVYNYAINGDLAHQNLANRGLVILNTAFALNKDLQIVYESDNSANPAWCPASSCRELVQIEIMP